jgi:hypothetical protein
VHLCGSIPYLFASIANVKSPWFSTIPCFQALVGIPLGLCTYVSTIHVLLESIANTQSPWFSIVASFQA